MDYGNIGTTKQKVRLDDRNTETESEFETETDESDD